MKSQIKELRVKIDGLAQLTKGLKSIDDYYIPEGEYAEDLRWRKVNSREVKKAYDSLIFAKAWLGKILGELGAKSPYPKDGTRKTVKDIEPTADTHKGVKYLEEKGNWNTDYNYIEKVDFLREEISRSFLKLQNIELSDIENHISKYVINNVKTHLSEARFWLGFELQRIKENE